MLRLVAAGVSAAGLLLFVYASLAPEGVYPSGVSLYVALQAAGLMLFVAGVAVVGVANWLEERSVEEEPG